MASRTGQQNLSNWLILIPLVIVPAVAVFGVPEFGSLAAGGNSAAADLPELSLGDEAPLNGEIPSLYGNEIGHSTTSTEAPLARNGWNDPFQAPELLSNDARRSSQPISPGGFDPENAFADSNVVHADFERAEFDSGPGLRFSDPPQSVANGELKAYSRKNESDRGHSIRGASAESAESAETLSWRAAVRKLNQLGVREIQLSQTAEPFVFRFSCDYTPGNNPRITRRFEAEAGEPLKAVESVIEQVESWLARPTP
ncbi:MAG TPA: hypothetical protein VLA12_14795 [Planctomycetaceae bacterium]|nr:hypothetical protein [Planctomycetaceae bacterium]